MNALRVLISLGSAILFVAIIFIAGGLLKSEPHDPLPIFVRLFGFIIALFWGLLYLIRESIEARRKLFDLEGKIDKIWHDSETPEAVSDHPTAKNSTKSSKDELTGKTNNTKNALRVLISLISAIVFVASIVFASGLFKSESYDFLPTLVCLIGFIIFLLWGLLYLIRKSIEARRKLSDLEGKIDKIRHDSETPEAVSDHLKAKNSTQSSKDELTRKTNNTKLETTMEETEVTQLPPYRFPLEAEKSEEETTSKPTKTTFENIEQTKEEKRWWIAGKNIIVTGIICPTIVSIISFIISPIVKCLIDKLIEK